MNYSKDEDKKLCPHCEGRGGFCNPDDWPMGVQECFECYYPWSQYTRRDKEHVKRLWAAYNWKAKD